MNPESITDLEGLKAALTVKVTSDRASLWREVEGRTIHWSDLGFAITALFGVIALLLDSQWLTALRGDVPLFACFALYATRTSRQLAAMGKLLRQCEEENRKTSLSEHSTGYTSGMTQMDCASVE